MMLFQLLTAFLSLIWVIPSITIESVIRVSCETTKGQIEIEVYPEWAPVGAQHFLELVVDGFYTNISFFRCVPRFLTQFGISDQPEQLHWHTIRFRDDVPKPRRPIMKHDVSFAGGGPDSRTTQVFIAFEDLPFLGEEPWETPFGRVVEGEETLSALYKVRYRHGYYYCGDLTDRSYGYHSRVMATSHPSARGPIRRRYTERETRTYIASSPEQTFCSAVPLKTKRKSRK